MDKLQWFKFAPSDWMMGKIMRCDEITQARYIRLVCLYWNKECNLSYEDAEIEIDKEYLDVLIKKKIVKYNNDFIFLEFLDEQMEGIAETSVKRRDAVNKRWNKLKQSDTSVLQTNTSVLQNDTEESREEERREEKIREKWYRFFLDDWNKYKIKYKKQKSNLRTLDVSSQDNLKQIAKDFSKEDIKKAIVGLLMQKVFPNDGDYTTDPRHLLKDGGIFINKYIDAQENNKRNIYGKSEVE